MECLAHVINGACKAGVVDVQSEGGSLETSSTREKMNMAITWTKKSQKGAVALIQTQNHCKPANVCLLDPSKTRFEYILNYPKSLLTKKDAI